MVAPIEPSKMTTLSRNIDRKSTLFIFLDAPPKLTIIAHAEFATLAGSFRSQTTEILVKELNKSPIKTRVVENLT
jgi:hypothetical protein